MIVHNDETLEEALQMLASSSEGVRYSDQYAYIIITTPETLELQCRRALVRDDIAVVVPRGQERGMEDHARELPRVKERRAREEKRKFKEWMREHPELAKASPGEMSRITKQIRKGGVK